MSPPLTPDDWKRLRALRDRFLTDAREAYWTPRDLALYDATFAQRIGWKWDAALATLDRAGWKPASRRLLDWGCGSGVAGRVVAAWSGIVEAEVFDQSGEAAGFAVERLRAAGVNARRAGAPDVLAPGTLLVLSHVAGELEPMELERLARVAATAEEVIWVEPGSHEVSRRLGSARAALAAGGHRFVGPCPHDAPCPVLAAGNERHWCHFFATPPGEVFHSAFWREFATEVEVDLRSLPYSFLATTRLAAPERAAGAERLIGRPREYKAHLLAQGCGADGALHERMLQKRDAPELFRALTKRGLDGLFAWETDPARPERVRTGRHLG